MWEEGGGGGRLASEVSPIRSGAMDLEFRACQDTRNGVGVCAVSYLHGDQVLGAVGHGGLVCSALGHGLV